MLSALDSSLSLLYLAHSNPRASITQRPRGLLFKNKYDLLVSLQFVGEYVKIYQTCCRHAYRGLEGRHRKKIERVYKALPDKDTMQERHVMKRFC
ncbi:hypothetical protein NDU88_002925 [Pleurodeles waltl]|uniref:Uncharacterized protein n=1 Tax=Pleurodeles waltl TaxID=8319 RepID=A0AAV7UAN9_PLEWA|nr:hypothetical protein NDU88_002925 [Pleurodeles waltl]